ARSCANNGRIRFFTSRNDDAHNSKVVPIDAPITHDLRIMVTHGFRNQTNVPAKSHNCNASLMPCPFLFGETFVASLYGLRAIGCHGVPPGGGVPVLSYGLF
ncbi:MAG: hypothetical protein WB760_06445, partial [Xanthobacteraceae bacterium]